MDRIAIVPKDNFSHILWLICFSLLATSLILCIWRVYKLKNVDFESWSEKEEYTEKHILSLTRTRYGMVNMRKMYN